MGKRSHTSSRVREQKGSRWDFLLAGALGGISLALVCLPICGGGALVLGLIPLLALVLGFPSDISLIVLACSGVAAYALLSPFLTLYYLVYGVVLSAVVGFCFSKKEKLRNEAFPVARVLISFLTTTTLMMVCVSASSLESHELRTFFPGGACWDKICVCVPGIFALVTGIVCFITIEVLRVFSFPFKEYVSPVAFWPSGIDYFLLMSCLGGLVLFSEEDQSIFLNLLVVGGLAFFVDAIRELLGFSAHIIGCSKVGGSKEGKARICTYLVWFAGLVLIIPILITTAFSFFQPWLKWLRAGGGMPLSGGSKNRLPKK